MIVCEGLNKQYGKQVVLSDFSCRFEDTGFYLLCGESGSGKTTLINILSGMIPFDGGRVTVNDREFHSVVEPAEAGVEFDYITQAPFFADFLSVSENLELISDDKEGIRQILAQFRLTHAADQSPAALSGGERQRLSIARACLSKKKVLFLDEPTAALDEDNKAAVVALLKELKKDTLVICASHDEMARGYADRILSFHKCSETREPPAAVRSAPVRRHAPQRNRSGERKFCVFLRLRSFSSCSEICLPTSWR